VVKQVKTIQHFDFTLIHPVHTEPRFYQALNKLWPIVVSLWQIEKGSSWTW